MMDRISILLVSGELPEAAAEFFRHFDVPILHPQEPVLRSEVASQLAELLGVQTKKTFVWWLSVGECWSELGYPELAAFSLSQARSLAKSGAALKWEILERAAALSVRSAAALERFPPPTATRSQPLRQSSPGESNKRQRLKQIHVSDMSQELDDLHQDLREGQIRDALWAMNGRNAARYQPLALVDAWHRSGEPVIALEEFFSVFHAKRPATWLARETEGLLICGLALRAAGDPVSAYACFDLIAIQNPLPTEPDNGSPAVKTIKMAHEQRKNLAGLRSTLTIDETALWLGVGGIQTLRWYVGAGLQGRLWEMLERSRNPLAMLTPALARRTWRRIATSNGWLEAAPKTTAGRSPHCLTSGARPPMPLASTHTPRERTPVEKSKKDARSSGRRILSRAHQPLKLRDALPTALPGASLAIGFSAGRTARPMALDIGAGSTSLCIVPVQEDFLTRSIARQIVGLVGVNLVWIRLEPDSLGDQPDKLGVASLVRKPQPSSLARECLHALATFRPLRQAARGLLLERFPSDHHRAAECLDALLSDLAKFGIWKYFDCPTKERLAELAVDLVIRVGELNMTQPAALRRAAGLVRYCEAILSFLYDAVAFEVHPAESAKEKAFSLHIAVGDRSSNASFTALVVLGTLLYVFEKQAQLKYFESFELTVSKRPDSKGKEKPVRSPAKMTGPSEDTDDYQPADFWTKMNLESAQSKVFLVTGPLDRDLRSVVEWLTPSELDAGRLTPAAIFVARAGGHEILSLGLASRFRQLVLGGLPGEQQKLIEVSTSIRTRLKESEKGRVELITLAGGGFLSRQEMVLWPEVFP